MSEIEIDKNLKKSLDKVCRFVTKDSDLNSDQYPTWIEYDPKEDLMEEEFHQICEFLLNNIKEKNKIALQHKDFFVKDLREYRQCYSYKSLNFIFRVCLANTGKIFFQLLHREDIRITKVSWPKKIPVIWSALDSIKLCLPKIVKDS